MKFLMTYAQRPGAPPPTPEQMAKLGAYTQRNIASGVVVMTGGLERTAKEYETLLGRAGFRVTRVLPTAGPFGLVEARPA